MPSVSKVANCLLGISPLSVVWVEMADLLLVEMAPGELAVQVAMEVMELPL
jgi:hypothetical protein